MASELVEHAGHVAELLLLVPTFGSSSAGGGPVTTLMSRVPGRGVKRSHALRRLLLASQREVTSGISMPHAALGQRIVRAQK